MGEFVTRPEIDWPVQGGWAEGACFDLRDALGLLDARVADLETRMTAAEGRLDDLEFATAPAYGELSETNETGSALSLSSGNWTKWVTSDTAHHDGTNVVASTSTDNLTIGTNGGGTYLVTASFAVDLSSGAELQMALFKDGAEVTDIRMDVDISAVASYQNLTLSGLVVAVATNAFDIRFSCSATRTADVKHANFTMHRVAV